MELSVFKILLILVAIFVFVGVGKLPNVMGDLGKGIRLLKEGLKGDEAKKPEDPKQIADNNNIDKNV